MAIKKKAKATPKKTTKKVVKKTSTKPKEFKAPVKKAEFELPESFESKAEFKRKQKALNNKIKKNQMELKDILKANKIKSTELKKLKKDSPGYTEIQAVQAKLKELAEIKQKLDNMAPESSGRSVTKWEYPEGMTDPKIKTKFRRFMRNHTRGENAISIEEATKLFLEKGDEAPKKSSKKTSDKTEKVTTKKTVAKEAPKKKTVNKKVTKKTTKK